MMADDALFDDALPVTQTIAEPVWDILHDGSELVFIAFGSILNKMNEYVKTNKLDVKIVNARFIKPLDTNMIDQLIKMDKPIIIYEESTLLGGFGSSILEYIVMKNYSTTNIHLMGIPEQYVAHGSKDELLCELKLDLASIIQKIQDLL